MLMVVSVTKINLVLIYCTKFQGRILCQGGLKFSARFALNNSNIPPPFSTENIISRTIDAAAGISNLQLLPLKALSDQV